MALHRAVADRLRADPALAERALARVAGWLEDEPAHPYARSWRALLTGPRDELLAFLMADDERARAHRQASPFAGALSPRERWRVLREASDG